MMTNEEIRRYDNIVECGIATAENAGRGRQVLPFYIKSNLYRTQ